jgi:hypothetical protein
LLQVPALVRDRRPVPQRRHIVDEVDIGVRELGGRHGRVVTECGLAGDGPRVEVDAVPVPENREPAAVDIKLAHLSFSGQLQLIEWR